MVEGAETEKNKQAFKSSSFFLICTISRKARLA